MGGAPGRVAGRCGPAPHPRSRRGGGVAAGRGRNGAPESGGMWSDVRDPPEVPLFPISFGTPPIRPEMGGVSAVGRRISCAGHPASVQRWRAVHRRAEEVRGRQRAPWANAAPLHPGRTVPVVSLEGRCDICRRRSPPHRPFQAGRCPADRVGWGPEARWRIQPGARKGRILRGLGAPARIGTILELSRY